MSKFYLNEAKIEEAVQYIAGALSAYQSTSDKITQAYRLLLNQNGGGIETARNDIVRLGKEYDRQYENLSAMKSLLGEISSDVALASIQGRNELQNTKYDKKNSDIDNAIKEIKSEGVGAKVGKEALKGTGKFIEKLLKEGSVTGGLIAPAAGLLGKKIDALKISSALVKAVGNSGKVVLNNAKVVAKNAYLSKGYLTQSELDEFFLKKGASERIGNYAKWGGYVLDAMTSFKDNVEEFGGNLSNRRLWEETAVETTLTIGSGAVAKVAAGAIVGAVVGTAGAPVWAMAAATVVTGIVIDKGLDLVSKAVTGNDKGWKENVSDYVVEHKKEIGNTLKDGILGAVCPLHNVITAGRSIVAWAA